MSFSSLATTMSTNNASIIIYNQPWFIPFDIFNIICVIFAIILALIFLLIIIFDKTCHTVPMILVANSCLSELIFAINMVAMTLFTLQNDLKQIYFYDSHCIFQGYMCYMAVGIQNYSYLLQSIYRYISIVYPTRLFWQSAKFQIFLISLTWIFGIIYPIPLVYTNQIIYHVDDQICQMSFGLSFITIFNVSYLYLIPMGIIILIYLKMIKYVREMSRNVTPVNTLFHAQRELKMIQRIVLLVFIIVSLGFPYTIFIFMSFFKKEPKYHFRIAYIFVDTSLAFIMIILFKTTEQLKTFVMKQVNRRAVTVIPTMT